MSAIIIMSPIPSARDSETVNSGPRSVLQQNNDHAANCGVPVSNAKLNYTSTLEGSILTLTCENDTSTDGEILRLSVICHSSGSWIPDPAQFTCSSSSFTTVPPGTEILINSSPHSSGSYSKYLSHYQLSSMQFMVL